MRLSRDGRTVWLLPELTAATFSLSVEPGWVSPSYGVKVATSVLVWRTAVTGPIDASYLFAEARLTMSERSEVADALRRSSACVKFS